MLKVQPLLLLLFALPIAAAGLILAARRWKFIPDLSRALVISGSAGAVFTALVVFISSTVPIAPYETGRNAWNPIVNQFLLSLYTGFGLGVTLGAPLIAPVLWLKAAKKKKHQEAVENRSAVRQKSE